MFEALRAGESEALAVSPDRASRAFLDEVFDALVAFLFVALWALLEDAGAVLELEALGAGDAVAGEGLGVEGEEFGVAAADLVALAVDEFVAGTAADSDALVFAGLRVEAQLAVSAAGHAHARAVHLRLASGTAGLASAVSQGLAFWAGESDALADSSVEALVDRTSDSLAAVGHNLEA